MSIDKWLSFFVLNTDQGKKSTSYVLEDNERPRVAVLLSRT